MTFTTSQVEIPLRKEDTESSTGLRAGMLMAQARKADAGSYAVVPEGAELRGLHEFTELAHAPHRTRRTVTITDERSFVAYIKRFAQDSTVVFADAEQMQFTAIIDYDTREYPEHGVHRAIYKCPLSDDWRAWTTFASGWRSQLELATFLEEQAHNVVKPDGADLLELATELQIDRQREFKGGVKSMQSGLISLRYEETDKASIRGGAMEIPTQVWIRVPMFYRGAMVEQVFFLRYKLDGGAVKFRLDAHRMRETMDNAFQVALDGIAVDLPSVEHDGETADARLEPVPIYRGVAPN